MTEVFLKLLNMSIAAGWIVLAAVLLRAVMRRSPTPRASRAPSDLGVTHPSRPSTTRATTQEAKEQSWFSASM